MNTAYVKNHYSGKSPDSIKNSIKKEGFHPLRITHTTPYEYHPHQHPETKLLAFLDGEMEVKIANEAYACTKGDRVLIPGNTVHSATVAKTCVFFWAERVVRSR